MNKKLKHITHCLMIDTMGLRVENVPNLKLPKAYSQLSEDPEIAHNTGWAKGNLKSESGKFMSMRVRTVKSSSQLLVEGSNSMQYLDHNIVSSGDAVMTAFSMLDAVRRQHPLHLDENFRPRLFMQGNDIEVTRLDTPAMLRLPDGLNAGALINALAFAGLRAGVATSIYPNETVYFDQHSQLESLKAYVKAIEMRRSRRELALPATETATELMRLAETTLRFEAVFRLKQLHRTFGGARIMPAMLSPEVLAGMFCELLEKYNLRGNLRCALGSEDLMKIRLPYRSTVALWQNGVDLRSHFKGNEQLLTSHRRVIKKEHNIDVFLPPPGEINVPIELGEILRVENFVPIPAAIRSDPALFYQRDMRTEFRGYCQQNGISSVSAAYLDPYGLADNDDESNGTVND